MPIEKSPRRDGMRIQMRIAVIKAPIDPGDGSNGPVGGTQCWISRTDVNDGAGDDAIGEPLPPPGAMITALPTAMPI